MGNLKEISRFKRYEIGRELSRERGNNWAVIITKNGKRIFDSIYQKKADADMRQAKLKKIAGLDPKVSLAAAKPKAPVNEEDFRKDLKVGDKVVIRNIKTKRSKTYTLKKKLGGGKFEADPGGKIIHPSDVDELVENSTTKTVTIKDPISGKTRKSTEKGLYGQGVVYINKKGHFLHGKKADVFYWFTDGRINVKVKTGPNKANFSLITLKVGQFSTFPINLEDYKFETVFKTVLGKYDKKSLDHLKENLSLSSTPREIKSIYKIWKKKR